MSLHSSDSRPQQYVVDEVTIVHAGENLELIRSLACSLEKHLKLGQQVEFARTFKPGTDIAEYIKEQLCRDDRVNLVVVLTDKFFQVCSSNKTTFEQIKRKICFCAIPSKIALVSPTDLPSEWSTLKCINLELFVNEIEAGGMVDAVYKQWFGPGAKLPSRSGTTEYTPEKVKIIHGITNPRETFWKQTANAIEEVADLESTAQCRRVFKKGISVAQTVLDDLQRFQECASQECCANAVILWCPDMLWALNQDLSAKQKFIEILCKDKKQQKMYAHVRYGVKQQEMKAFAEDLWTFLSNHHYNDVEFPRDGGATASSDDLKQFAQAILSVWTGLRTVAKQPAESTDPSIYLAEELEMACHQMRQMSVKSMYTGASGGLQSDQAAMVLCSDDQGPRTQLAPSLPSSQASFPIYLDSGLAHSTFFPQDMGQGMLPAEGQQPWNTNAFSGSTLPPIAQPVSSQPVAQIGQNRLAPSGCDSQVMRSGQSGSSASSSIQRSMVVSTPGAEGSVNVQNRASCPSNQEHILSTSNNPVRLSSDAEQGILAEIHGNGFQSLPTCGTPQEPRQFTNRSSWPNFGNVVDESARGPIPLSEGTRSLDNALAQETLPDALAVSDLGAGSGSRLGSGPGSVPGSGMGVANVEQHCLTMSDPISNLLPEVIRDLKMHLDPTRDTAVSDWRDLASHFHVSAKLRSYWKSMQGINFSPTEELLLNHLKTKEQEPTIGHLLVVLETIKRYDAYRTLKKYLHSTATA